MGRDDGKGVAQVEWTRDVLFGPSSDGKRLVTGSWGRRIQVWDATTGKDLLKLKGHGDLVMSVAFSPDGKRLATAGGEDYVKLWDAATGKERHTLKGKFGKYVGYNCATFRPDGKLVAGGGSADDSDDVDEFFEFITLWDPSTGKVTRTLWGQKTDDIYSVAFNPNGKRLATGSENGTVTVWDVSDDPM